MNWSDLMADGFNRVPEFLTNVLDGLISILDDSVLHVGQAAYIRGMIQGKGWQKY